jgi:hypothetical protein
VITSSTFKIELSVVSDFISIGMETSWGGEGSSSETIGWSLEHTKKKAKG